MFRKLRNKEQSYKTKYGKVKFALEQAMKTYGGGGGVKVRLYSCFNLGVRWG
jgi:hypothetical protein